MQAEQTRLAHAASLIEGRASRARCAVGVRRLGREPRSARRRRSCARSQAYDAALAEPLELIESAAAQVDEAAHALRRYADRVELDPGRLAEVERRVEAIHATARKFKVAPEALPELAERLTVRLAELEVASDVEALRAQEEAAEGALRRACRQSLGRRARTRQRSSRAKPPRR